MHSLCIELLSSGRRDSVPIAPMSPSQIPGGSVSSEVGSLDTQSVSSLTVMVLSDSANLSEEEPEEVVTFDAQPNEPGKMPNSSYKAEDTLFTWTDITGEA